MPKNAYTTVKVYNALGKEIATVVDKFETSGNHVVSYDASNLPSGIYFYTMKTPEFTQTKKMALVR